MRVIMRHQISGKRDGEDWPAPGKPIDVPDDEGARLILQGMADEPEIDTSPETAEVDPGGEVAADVSKPARRGRA